MIKFIALITVIHSYNGQQPTQHVGTYTNRAECLAAVNAAPVKVHKLNFDVVKIDRQCVRVRR
jgi:hypothetical protein